MKTRAPFGLLLMLILAVAFSACSKEEPVAPAGAFDGALKSAVSDQPGENIAGAAKQPDGGPITGGLRGGGSGEEGSGDGGISDDGDDGSDSEQNRKNDH